MVQVAGDCAGWTAEGAGCRSSTSAEEPGGAWTKDIDPASSVAAEAYANAAIMADQMQRLPRSQQQQQLAAAAPLSKLGMRLLGLRGGGVGPC